jgi:hypothetical protein
MNSPGHRHNILTGEFTEIGIGIALGSPGTPTWGATYTTDFGAVAGHEAIATAASAPTAAAASAPTARKATKATRTAKRCGSAPRARAAKASKAAKAKAGKKGAKAKRAVTCGGTPRGTGRAAKTTKK